MRRLFAGITGGGSGTGRARPPRAGLDVGVTTWALGAALVGVAAGAAALAPRLPGAGLDRPLPFWALIGIVAVAETIVVVLDVGRRGLPVSAGGMALVLGLFLAAPQSIVPAEVLGAAVVVALRRRALGAGILELAGLAAGAGIAVVVFRLAGGGSTEPDQLRAWGAALAATLAAAGTGLVVAVAAARGAPAIAGGDPRLQVVLLCAGATVTTTALGLLAVHGLRSDAVDAGLVLIPAGALCLVARAWAVERQRNHGVRMLYDSTRVFRQTPEMELAILDLLSGARAMFKAEHAELTLLGTADSGQCFRTAVSAGDRIALMAPVELTPFEEVVAVVTENREGLLLSRGADPTITDYLEQRGLGHAMLAPLRGERGVIGTMLVADRLSATADFDRNDLKLLATLANHATVSLEYGRLEASVDRLTALQGRLEQQAFHDPLTGLANRALFSNRLEHSLGRRRTQVAVLFIDLDEFKRVNDNLGHTAGDELLRGVARRLGDCLRPADTAARLGGDEFAVLLEGIAGLADATSVAERVVAGLGRPQRVGDRECTIRASVGVALGRAGETTADQLLHDADVAMYVAKGRGKGRYQVFEPSMQAAVLQRHELKAELAAALQAGEIAAHFQAVVDLRTGAIVGTEAAPHWRRPGAGAIPAAEICELAAEAGLAAPLGLHLLRAAAGQTAQWSSHLPAARGLRLAVNVAPELLLTAGFCDDLAAILAQTGLDPGALIVEVTETAIIDRIAEITRRFAELRALGVRLGIDDFGTGHSSLTALRELPLDVLTIGRPFVDALTSSADGAGLVRAMVGIAQALELEMVAAGVDHPAQAEMLVDMGVQMGQGDLFHRPGDPLVLGAHLSGQALRRRGDRTAEDAGAGPVEREMRPV